MRQLFEDSLMIYRQEADSFLTIVAPAAVLGPVLVIVAASGFIATLVTLPIFVLLILGTYAVCVRAASLVLRNLAPEPGTSAVEALQSAAGVLATGAAPALLLAVTAACAVSISMDGLGIVAIGVVAAGAIAFGHWGLRHAYDASLVLCHDLPANEAVRIGPLLAALEERWTPSLLMMTVLPLVPALLVAWGAGLLLAPPVGGALFVLAVALWLPLPGLILTIDCDRLLLEATEPAQRRAS